MHLASEVPTSVVEQLPVVHLGDVGGLLADSAYADPIVMGYGCPTSTPSCDPVLRRGRIRHQQYLHVAAYRGNQSAILGLATPYPADSAQLHASDLGGPLFLFDAKASRWVLAGVLSDIFYDTGAYVGPIWNYLGSWTGAAPDDHAGYFAPYLGD